jgi:hypothetical protein
MVFGARDRTIDNYGRYRIVNGVYQKNISGWWLSHPSESQLRLLIQFRIYGKIKIFQTTNQIINHEYTPPPQLSSSSNSICISKSWMIQENPLDEQPNRSKGLNYSGLYVRRWGSPIFCVWTNGLYIYILIHIYIYISVCVRARIY